MPAEETQEERRKPLLFLPNILTFHKLQRQFSWGITNYSPGRFERLLTFIHDRHFRFFPLEMLLSEKPSNGVAITTDDGYQHLMEVLPPLMERLGIRPTVFVPTAYMGRGNSWDYSFALQNVPHLNEQEIRELSELGVRFGSHGHRHTDLTGLDGPDLKGEMERSKGTLEDITGAEITTISYPFGRYNDRVVEAAAQAGYRLGFTMSFPTSWDGPLQTGRYAVYAMESPRSVLRKFTPGAGRSLELIKCGMIGAGSAGTVLLNRFRNRL